MGDRELSSKLKLDKIQEKHSLILNNDTVQHSIELASSNLRARRPGSLLIAAEATSIAEDREQAT